MSRLISRRAPLLAMLAAMFALVPAATAAAEDCEAPTNYFGDNAIFNLDPEGEVVESDGFSFEDDTWDFAGRLEFRLDGGGSYSPYTNPDVNGCVLEDGRREVAFPADTTTVAGLSVSRKVYVPTDANWVRYLDTFTNTSGGPLTIDIGVWADHFADDESDVGTSSSGDGEATPADDWATTIDTDGGGGTYQSPHAWFNWQAEFDDVADVADAVAETDPNGNPGNTGDYLSARFDNVQLAAGQTVSYMSVFGSAPSPDTAAAGARFIAPEPVQLTSTLAADELARTRNWRADGDGDRDGVPNSVDNCPSDANANQLNTDGAADGGDVCDFDDDNDKLTDEVEAAIGTDPKRVDTDGDRVNDSADQCPREAGTLANGCRAEDRPPTVGWTGPAENARLRPAGANTLAATAGDDSGVARVVFVDDGRVICEDTTAPYTCAYAPEGRDVGSNTLAATAVDTAGQTATAFRVVNLRRFNPTRVTARTTPSTDASLPFRFTTTGRVGRPERVSRAQGCRGRVSVTFKSRNTTVSTRRVSLSRRCTYRSSVAFRVPRRLFGSRLEVQVRFLGNSVLAARRARTRRVTVG